MISSKGKWQMECLQFQTDYCDPVNTMADLISIANVGVLPTSVRNFEDAADSLKQTWGAHARKPFVKATLPDLSGVCN